MEYIISEQQSDRLAQKIIKFFDDNLTPHDGWSSPLDYKLNLEQFGDTELFFPLETTGSFSGEEPHYYYSECDNPNFEIPEGGCPLILIPEDIIGKLDGFFGDFWIPLFKMWFHHHTGLSVNHVAVME